MADIMSQEQINRLLSGPRDDRQRANPILTYDFAHPSRVSRDQQRTLENLHWNLARMCASTFSNFQRSIVDVDIAFVDQTTYAEYIMSLSNPSCSYSFTVQPLGGPTIIDFALPLTYGFVDRSFGGDGGNPPENGRPMTAIERTVMTQVITRMLADLEATWEPLLKILVSDCELETNPEFIQVARPPDTVVLIAFEVNMAHASGLVTLCYPYFTLEPIMSYLNVQTWASRSRKGDSSERRKKRFSQLKSVKTNVRVVAGRGEVDAEDISDIAVGDTIVLETRKDDPGVVYVQDQPIFLAKSGLSTRGRNAVQIIRSIPPPEGKRYI
jgi:flagellar motor switch protein FliM